MSPTQPHLDSAIDALVQFFEQLQRADVAKLKNFSKRHPRATKKAWNDANPAGSCTCTCTWTCTCKTRVP